MVVQFSKAQMKDTLKVVLLITLGVQPSPSPALSGKHLPSSILLFNFIM